MSKIPLKTKPPKLRFKSFDDFWSSSQLQDITSYVDYRGRGPEKSESGIFLVTAKNIKKGFIDYESSQEYVSIENYADVMSKGLPQVGDVLFTTEAPLGNVAQVDNADIALAQRVIKLRAEGQVTNEYLLHYMLSSVYQRLITRKAIGSTVLGISGKELHQTRINFPSLPEQQKIAKFLSAVDEKIQQLTRKKELLEQYKKGVMQQLFSGKLRFKDENGKPYPKWEEKRLGEVLEIGSGRDYKHLGQGNIPVFGTGGLMTMVDDFLYDGETVCIGRKGTIDKPMFHKGKIWTVDTLFYTHSFKNALPKFVYYVFQLINWREHNEASGVPSLSKTTIEKLKFTFPSVDEQQKISNFLTSLDAKIENVATQIIKVQEFKKGLLQQMFI